MNPSRFQLPQKVSLERQHARRATRRIEQKKFQFETDSQGVGSRRLPPCAKSIPPDMDFPGWQKAQLALAKLEMMAKARYASARMVFRSFKQRRDYEDVYRLLFRDSGNTGRWRCDTEVARQRLEGANPMHLRKLKKEEMLGQALWDAAERVLRARGEKGSIGDLFDRQQLYYTDYSELWDPFVRENVRGRDNREVHLAAPTGLFWFDGNQLRPLAIQLKPRDEIEHNPAVTPLDEAWHFARAHMSVADAHVHEGVYHLLETHLVNEAVALCLYRQLHPDHPLRQLLQPHYQGTLAINRIAREHLLAPGGPINRAMAAGAKGTLNLARLAYSKWDWKERTLNRDLEERGVDERPSFATNKSEKGEPEEPPGFYYAKDAKAIHTALRNFVKAFLGTWYRDDKDVVEDFELQDFIRELSSPEGGDIPGFPLPAKGDSPDARADRIDSLWKLFDLVTEMMFRAGPQHAAVNNGQFDAYGEVADNPGLFCAPLPESLEAANCLREEDFWRSLPPRDAVLAQATMVWVLSLPTRRNLLYVGEFSDFDPRLSPEALEAIIAVRRRLQMISYKIQERNAGLAVPYRYLDPQNVSRSTDV